MRLAERKLRLADILTEASVRNALAVHAAFGGSTNLLLHVPAVAFAAGLKRPTIDDWLATNRSVPRLVDALPNGPVGHPTVQVFLAGGVPEVMLHLRDAGLLDLSVLTVAGCRLEQSLEWWEQSERRQALRRRLRESDGVDPDRVIFSPDAARAAGLTSTMCFPRGNLAPEGAVIKSTAIDPAVIDPDGVYRHTGPARVLRASGMPWPRSRPRPIGRCRPGTSSCWPAAGHSVPVWRRFIKSPLPCAICRSAGRWRW